MINKKDLESLIEPHLYLKLKCEEYTTAEKKPIELLRYDRFDLAFKLFYLDLKNKNRSLAEKVYEDHIAAFSLGRFVEPGSDKEGAETFITEFERIYTDFCENGFDKNRTLIPLSENGSIANGAHRVACALHVGSPVRCVDIAADSHVYDYDFFYKRNVPIDILDMAANKFVEYSDNVYMAFLWPIGIRKNREVENILGDIVYKKTIKLNANGARNLLSHVYRGQEWIGDPKNNFCGIDSKLVECFRCFDKFNVILFQADDLEDVLRKKDAIRELFGMGKHSIHMTDTKEESVRMARLVLNGNGEHFLNHARPNKYISTDEKMKSFKEFLDGNKLDRRDVVLDAGIVLSCYGLREATDVDFFCHDKCELNIGSEAFDIHDECLKYYDVSKEELLYDPRCYFYFSGLKFVSLDLVYRMKRRRSEKKDINDCSMIESLVEDDRFKMIVGKCRQSIYYGVVKVRQKAILTLARVGLYEVVKKMVRGRR